MVTAVNPVTAATQQKSSPSNAQDSRVLSSDFNTFIRMLTTQAKYQNPLEPLDSSEYAAQLAQFSMVEQQTKTNDTLAALVEKMGATNMAELSNWIGKDARAIAPAHFSGSPVTVSPAPLAAADKAYLVVRDAQGEIIDRYEIPVSAEPVTWSGLESDGSQRAHGLYSIAIQSYKSDELLLDEAASVYHPVTEAQIENGEVILILEGGQAILANMVTGVRANG
ncbi:flagellar hook assembly protein FlgD [Ruegeria pomeroyi]|uniref:Basal-body rod modification protein FlgD n=1 Tax=Ruegeria alba TaxID=2916756 RepID=A0ABS9NV41_9RHOB|nr:flagellar hook capping FlgD N-terminal domain-containing protein [Ruegeria alba]MCE8521754.1 flagellar hook assembly protein FlgD [Ruegeria pomeroyi]MCE8533682.1 flagellar hook assembly protein FlgD [Ruegeria pomeroyi]MCG6558083.1 flagellar hook assembly protein FlgD [Ruegeria alba]